MLQNADLGDRKAFDRTARLLEGALDVHVTGFLEAARGAQSTPVLLLASRLLARKGPVTIIRPVAEAGLAHLDDLPEVREELLEAILSMIEKRGNEEALLLLRDRLLVERHDADTASRILRHLPPRGHLLCSQALLTCAADPEFEADDALMEAATRMPYPDLIPNLVDIVKAGREHYPHNVRIRAVKLLGAYEDSAVLQFVLENLSVLPHEEAREFTKLLSGYAGKNFDARVEKLLTVNDAGVRAALIAALPATKKESFLKQIRDAVGDADPDVRIAAIWALADFEDKRALGQATDKLRDPVERVRREAAHALGSNGGEPVVKQFKELLQDESEVETVKAAAIEGLGASQLKTSIDILVDVLEQGGELETEAVRALAQKQSKRDVEAIVGHMKDAEPGLRDRLTKVFREMATVGEGAMVELLKQDIPSLRPFVTDVLEKVGYVDSLIRRLSHRDPAVRRNAAGILSFIGTLPAFRGIVLAARDPDQEVRVKVTRALEALDSKDGKEILNELQSDPDKRVRKYTTWALQRLRAKSS
jgi:HEAT repeat protein